MFEIRGARIIVLAVARFRTLGGLAAAGLTSMCYAAPAYPAPDHRRRLARAVDIAPHHRLLLTLLVASAVLRVVWLARPDALIFDERFYVSAARVIVGIAQSDGNYADRPLGRDPNTEHPPLAKLIVAGSIRLLGDNPYGWRLPSVVFGLATIVLAYAVAARVSRRPDLSLVAAALLTFDNLIFVHSRIFTLDIFQLGFMLLGLFWYVSRRSALAGVGFALAALCKSGGVLGIAAVALYEGLLLLRRPPGSSPDWRPVLRRVGKTSVTFALSFLALLWAMDRLWVGYEQPLEHLRRIASYSVALQAPRGPSGIQSYPWQWLWNDVPIPYFRVDQQIKVGDTVTEVRPLIWFRGAMNPYVLGLLPLGLGFAGWVWWCRRPGRRAAALALAWFAATYLPFCVAAVASQRVMYLFYFLPTLPAVTLAGSLLLVGSGLPRPVLWCYLAVVLFASYGYFPFRPGA
jgi:dolichyl-phosphate-mannose-protein mannosyltransferase